ncbi:MAG TPA: cytochrome c oxidase assembly protein [Candidatus Methylomirabilis sp.]|nr:cytochrome c oxidase assembly protein [Candidatus Methylomirabilis sp.]
MSASLEPTVAVPVVVGAALYLRGWTRLVRRMPERFGLRCPIAFMTGLAILVIASSTPVAALSDRFLRAHMIQHLLLMVVAPPLLWMGAPMAPMLLGLPKRIRRAVAVWLAWPSVRRLSHMLADPRVSWTTFVITFWAWHVPALYELALRSHLWHHVEHACFFIAGLLFWRPVILPWPARSTWPRWAMIPYLVLADLQNGVLAAIFTFSDRVIYPSYAQTGGAWSAPALEDQAIAGVIMWVPGSVAFLLPVIWLVVTAMTSPRPGPVATIELDGRPRRPHEDGHQHAAVPGRE